MDSYAKQYIVAQLTEFGISEEIATAAV